MHEKSFKKGQERAAIDILLVILPYLRGESREDALIIYDRAQMRVSLRTVCEVLDCNGWSDDLDLNEVVEQYILPAARELQVECERRNIGKATFVARRDYKRGDIMRIQLCPDGTFKEL